MNDHLNNRLTPEELLESVWREENQSIKGKLKIFLGMAAGVGKTYAMLEEAQILRQNGVDVLIGSIDTHGRSETALLLKDLEILPHKKIIYKDKIFDELDLDNILKRKPEIVLIDELAHSNIPGVRHLKRWEDVIEILDNGIDVYTTLNIQHIESLKNIVESLAEVSIRETVPDFLFSKDTSIQLIDLTPDELLVRLYSGRVYLGSQSRMAARNFFQKERLLALREITLRYVAEIVDNDLRGMIPRTTTSNLNEKILVAISHHPHSQKLIRTARRLAFNLDIPWIALHVNDNRHLSESESAMLSKNIALAVDLGGEAISSNNLDIAQGIKHIARLHKVNLIIVGRSHKSTYLLNKYSLFERLAKECNDVDLLVIKEEYVPIAKNYSIIKFTKENHLLNYLNIGLLTLISLINWTLLPYIGYKFCGLIFMGAIIIFSLFFKKGAVLVSLLASAIIWATFFVSPDEFLELITPENFAFLLLYLVAVSSIGVLVDRIGKQKEMLQNQEEATQAIYEIVNHILKNTSVKETLVDIEACLERTLGGNCEILIKDQDLFNYDIKNLTPDEKERNAALWVLENDKEAGLSTSTLPLCKNIYIPVKGFDHPLAVIVYRPQGTMIVDDEKNFLYTVGQHLSLYIAQYEQQEHRDSA